MEKNSISDYTITIVNPSQLVLSIDEFFHLAKKLPSQSETLKQSEKKIFDQLGEKNISTYSRIVMFQINLDRIADKVNEQYQDGIYLDDDLDTVRYPYDRTIRTRNNPIEAPTIEKELSTSKITSIKVGKHRILENNMVSINKNSITSLSLSPSYDTISKTR